MEKEQRLTARARPASRARLAFLARASAALASSLDYEHTLASVAQLAVPALADFCIVDVMDEQGELQRVAAAHADPARQPLVDALRHAVPALGGGSPIAEVLRTGQPILFAEFSEERFARHAVDAAHLEVVRALGVRSSIVVPLTAREHTFGAITLVTAESGRRYRQRDLRVAMDLAGRCALAVDNARLYRQAQETLRARDELFDLVAHDLKNPLTVIIGTVQLLQRRVSQTEALATDPAVGRRLEQLATSAIQMRTMINDLLDLAHVRAEHQLTLSLEPTDLVAVAQRAAKEYRATSSRHRISVEASLPELVSRWDVARLERVVANLLSNAIKYSPAGGDITLRVRREEDDGRSWAVLSVRDQGIGIPAADLPHIFERFRRAGNTSGRIAGSGMGLASVCAIVEQHGGDVSAESVEGQGSTFTVRLPLC
ncbi:MAG: hypothetical protein RLZZ387_4490 [Chloroflexota bacterium]